MWDTLLNSIDRLFPKRTGAIFSNVYSDERTREIFETERARTDRTLREFSVVIFLKDNDPSETKQFRVKLLEHLKKRLRSCDSVGWLDGHISAILPETDRNDAKQLAQNVLAELSQNHSQGEFIVYTYPTDWYTDDKRSSKTLRDVLAKGSIASNDPEFEKKTPGNAPGFPDDGIEFPEALAPKTQSLWTRGFDIVGAASMLSVLSPIMMILAITIKFVSPGPIFFRQTRIGYLGSRFELWKFRTMHINAETASHEQYFANLIKSNRPMTKLDSKSDPRIIRFGKFIRQTGLDELPQLINVLRGEMSLVGPRPCLPNEALKYPLWNKRRFDTRPGLTGLWQVSGKNKTSFAEMIRLDIAYTQRKSVWMDTKIVSRTVPAIVKSFE